MASSPTCRALTQSSNHTIKPSRRQANKPSSTLDGFFSHLSSSFCATHFSVPGTSATVHRRSAP
eukprot:2413563-Prymnesium_polylepis.1